MKQFYYYLSLLLLFALKGYSQIYSQDFSDLGTVYSSFQYHTSYGTSNWNFSSNFTFGNQAGNLAAFLNNSQSTTPSKSTIFTGVIDLSQTTNPMLHLSYGLFKVGNEEASLTIYVLDNNDIYHTLESITEPTGSINDAGVVTLQHRVGSIDLSAYKNTPFKLAFEYQSDGNPTKGVVIDNITIHEKMTISTIVTDNNCYGNNIGRVAIFPQPTTGTYFYYWPINNSTNYYLPNLSPGTYDCVVRDAYGNSETVTETVTGPEYLQTLNNESTPATCPTCADGQLIINPFGGTEPYTILWNDGNTEFERNNVVFGTYSYTITDAHQCTYSNYTFLNYRLPLSISTFEEPITCYNQKAYVAVYVIEGTPPYTYSWSHDSTITSSGLALDPGVYICTVTDAAGEVAEVPFTIEPPVLDYTIDYTFTPPTCHGGRDGRVDITVVTDKNYTLSILNIDELATYYNHATDLRAGDYTIMLQIEGEPCLNSYHYTLENPTTPLVVEKDFTNPSNTVCNDGTASVSISGGVPPYTTTWSHGPTNVFTVGNLAEGSYSVNIEDAAGNCFIEEFTIYNSSYLYFSPATMLATCANTADGGILIEFYGDTTGYTFTWEDGSTDMLRTGLLPGDYILTATSPNGCLRDIVITVEYYNLISYTQGKGACYFGDNNIITATIDGDAADFTLELIPMPEVATQNGFVFSNVPLGTYQLKATRTDGCTYYKTIEVIELAPTLQFSYTVNAPLCPNDPSYSITVSSTDIPQENIFLDLRQNNQDVQSTFINGNTESWTYTFYNVAPGNYTLRASTETFCTLEVPAVVQAQDATSLIDHIDYSPAICQGSNTGAITVHVVGNSADHSIFWQTGQTSLTLNELAAGTYTYTLTHILTGCSETGSVTISEAPTMYVAQSIETNVSCYGANDGAATIVVEGGYGTLHYYWSHIPGESTNTVTNLQPGNHSLRIVDDLNCEFNYAIFIQEPSNLQPWPDATNNRCLSNPNGTAFVQVFGGTPPYTYLWENGETTSEITNLDEGDYVVTITDSHQCSVTATASVFNQIHTFVDLFYDGETITLTGDTIYDLQWYRCLADGSFEEITGETEESYTPTTSGSYTLLGNNNHGCTMHLPCVEVEVLGVHNPTLAATSIYPNPSNGVFTVQTNTAQTLLVYDITGKLLVSQPATPQATTLDLSRYANGIYLLKVQTIQGGTETFKLIKR